MWPFIIRAIRLLHLTALMPSVNQQFSVNMEVSMKRLLFLLLVFGLATPALGQTGWILKQAGKQVFKKTVKKIEEKTLEKRGYDCSTPILPCAKTAKAPEPTQNRAPAANSGPIQPRGPAANSGPVQPRGPARK